VKRTLILVGLFALLALTPGAALAKMPPYSVDVTPSDPTAGESIRVTVRFWNDAEHTRRSRWPDVPSFGGFLWAHAVDEASEAIQIDIRLVRPGVYRGEVKLPTPGRWVLCSDGGAIWCPGGRRIAGYESRKGFTVANAPAPPPTVSPGDSADPETPLIPIELYGLLAFVTAASVVVVRSVRSRHS
jgi:hypothetical protein